MRTMRMMVLALAAGVAGLAADARPSAAEAWSPWCAHYAAPGSTMVCVYKSFEQCLATIRGIGGACTPNLPPEEFVRAERPRRSVVR